MCDIEPSTLTGDEMQKSIKFSLLLPLSMAASLAVPMIASAKLPLVSPEAKQKADEGAARSAWTDKVGAYKLCLAQDRTADAYRRQVKASGKEPPSATNATPCADPGPFAYTPVAQKPLEAAGAHSPPGTANSPPSTNATAAEIQGKK